jgi:hypothetical protein
MMEENSPEMQTIFQISEMNLQRIEAERHGTRNFQPGTSTTWHTDAGGGEPYTVAGLTGFRSIMSRPIDHTLVREAQNQARAKAQHQFGNGPAGERFWNPNTGAFSLTVDGPPIVCR